MEEEELNKLKKKGGDAATGAPEDALKDATVDMEHQTGGGGVKEEGATYAESGEGASGRGATSGGANGTTVLPAPGVNGFGAVTGAGGGATNIQSESQVEEEYTDSLLEIQRYVNYQSHTFSIKAWPVWN